MAIQQFTIGPSESGDVPGRSVPMAQYVLSESTQFSVIGMDFDKCPVEVGITSTPEGMVQSSHLGKLSEQSFIFNAQIINSLNIDGWDFGTYPDPEIILLELL